LLNDSYQEKRKQWMSSKKRLEKMKNVVLFILSYWTGQWPDNFKKYFDHEGFIAVASFIYQLIAIGCIQYNTSE